MAMECILCDDQLKGLAAEVLKDMASLENLNWDDRENVVEDIEMRLGKMKQLVKGYYLEVRELEGNEKGEHANIAKNWEDKVFTINKKLEEQKKKWLVVDETKEVWENSASGMIRRAQDLQKDSQLSIERSKKMVQESKEAGKKSMEDLLVQSEAMNTVHNNMVTLSERLGSAGEELGTINRKEKIAQYITMCLCLSILALMLFIIVFWFKNGFPKSPPDQIDEEATSPLPEGSTNATRFRS